MCKLKKRYNKELQQACNMSISGSWTIGDDLQPKEVKKYIKWLEKDERISDFVVCEDYIDIGLWLDYCKNAEIDEEDEQKGR